MLDIIIPVYNDYKNLRYTLLSIAMQTEKEYITVYIIDDCSDDNKAYETLISEFSNDIKIKYYSLEKNVGPGIARQYGLDNSNGEYIMFMDSDDLLCNPLSVEILYKYAKDGYEYVSSFCFYERDNKTYNNDCELHAKIYKRSFIQRNNIKFNNTRYHEDMLFNTVALICNPKKIDIDAVTYIYSKNPKSLTQVSCEEIFNNLQYFIRNIGEIISFFDSKDKDNELYKKIINRRTRYIEGVYRKSSEDQRIKLKEWIEMYNMKKFIGE